MQTFWPTPGKKELQLSAKRLSNVACVCIGPETPSSLPQRRRATCSSGRCTTLVLAVFLQVEIYLGVLFVGRVDEND